MTQGIPENLKKTPGIICVHTHKKTVNDFEHNLPPQNIYP